MIGILLSNYTHTIELSNYTW